jgi:metallo-beta-lactamase family protein
MRALELLIGPDFMRADIHTLGGFFAYASRSLLLDWTGRFNEPRPRLCLIHGEVGAKTALCERVSEPGKAVDVPHFGERITF